MKVPLLLEGLFIIDILKFTSALTLVGGIFENRKEGVWSKPGSLIGGEAKALGEQKFS
jgi:hypothetical protein